LNVKNAFLNGDLFETMYMYQPPGFVDAQFPHHVCRLQRSLYELKQAPRAWFQQFTCFGYKICALEILHMANCNPTRTPVDTESKLSSDGDSISDPTLYRSLAGGLQYLTFTRPDISYALQQHQQTKHIEIDIHFVRDMVARGQVCVLHVPSRYEYADIFTKGLPSALFEEFRTSLSVRSSPAPRMYY
ncbi:ribonuclease H-like domain-containing protein, partial [Tanacetum coccineum]